MAKYVVVWASLIALTATTFGAARIDLGPWNVVVALAIAAAKASLVVLFFMHLKEHAATNRAFFGLGILFVVLLAGLTLSDLATRLPFTNPSYPPIAPPRP